jgi:segregation and condensation protein A
MSEAYETVLNHLMFHKALISDKDGGERISRYVTMLNEIDQGMHVALRDPFEKAVAAAFELVIEKQFDPWDIDLAQFTRMYLEKVQGGGPVNFVTAGKLVFMAWSILKLQSDFVLVQAQPPPADQDASPDWDLDAYREPEDLDFNQAVLGAGRMPIAEAIRREGHRAVTLMELMNAFDEARRDAEVQLQLSALREQAAKAYAPDFHTKVHSEDLSEDIGLTWSRIVRFNGSAIPLDHLAPTRDRWDLITVFVSVLFLAKMEKVKLWQDAYPMGDIFVQRTSKEAALNPEDLAGIPVVTPGTKAAAPAVAVTAPATVPVQEAPA